MLKMFLLCGNADIVCIGIKVCVLPVCEAFYLYPAPHLDACNGHPVPAEPVST